MGGDMDKKRMILGIALVIGGLVFASLGLLPKNTEKQAVADNWYRLSAGAGKETEAKAVRTEQKTVTEGSGRNRKVKTVHCPVYEFSVADKTYTATAVGDDCFSGADDITLRSSHAVLYDEKDPSIAFVKSDKTKAFYDDSNNSWIAAVAIGAFLILVGVVSILSARPKTPEQLARQAEAKQQADAELAKLKEEFDSPEKK